MDYLSKAEMLCLHSFTVSVVSNNYLGYVCRIDTLSGIRCYC